MSLLLQKTSNSFVEQLHPISILSYCGLLMMMAMIYTHPIFLVTIFLSIIFGIYFFGDVRAWKKTILFGLNMGILIVAINALISRNGTTILWEGPILPFLGRITISWEAICFGLTMALKLCLIFSVFCLYQGMMPADTSFSFFMRWTPKSALALILTSLMLPQMKRRLEAITIAMKVRGVPFDDQNMLTRIRCYYPLLKTMLIASLEDSWQTAESLYARAFNTGQRTFFSQQHWRRADTWILGSFGILLMIFILTLMDKRGFYTFYPRMQTLFLWEDSVFLSILFLAEILWIWKFSTLKILHTFIPKRRPPL